MEPLDRPAGETADSAVALGDPLRFPDRVRCGMVLPGGGREDTLRSARALEAVGFDSLWVGDHVSFHIPITESLTLLSFAAAATEPPRSPRPSTATRSKSGREFTTPPPADVEALSPRVRCVPACRP